MKYLSIILMSITLSACGMSIEEYNTRVEYCFKNNMKVDVIYQGVPDKAVRDIRCVDSNGSTFSSKEK